ncbi:MAG: hypothetical protein OSB70_07160 [Myxococcota bacterium]|nr:hypothetical protein [Myxococcota bacterium]
MQPVRSNPLLALLFAVALVAGAAAPSWALDDPRTNDRFARQALPAHLLPQIPALVPTSGAFWGSGALQALPTAGFVGISERLLRLPLRPVILGETPRTPTDAEQSVGVVFRFPLSL